MSPKDPPVEASVVEPAETNAPETQPLVEPAETPVFSVTKGEPTPEELAALTAVVLSLGSAEEADLEKPSVRHWVRRQQLRLGPTPGPGAWKRSGG